MLVMGLSLHANYSPALDWSGVNLANSKSFNHSMMMVSDALEKAEEQKTTAILLNAFLGWGIGSFIQGDQKGGIIQIILRITIIGALPGWIYGLIRPAKYIESIKKESKSLNASYNFKKVRRETDKVMSYNLTLASF